jgi:hypothetical protein
MRRLNFTDSNNTWVFNENNWIFYIKKLFLFSKNYKVPNVDFFFFDNFLHTINITSINLMYLTITTAELLNFIITSNTKLIFNLFSQLSNYNNLLITIDISDSFNTNSTWNYILFFILNPLISGIFLILFLFIFNNSLHNDYGSVLENSRTFFLMLYEEFILLWVNFASIKFESYEEALCIIILWPWCIFLVFTHIFSIENNEVFFIFVEWGLPVVYGYLILIESIWLFGVYFLVYLNGGRGRKFLLVTLVEDLIAFIILLARVTLQVVRGIICGLYHDFFKELTEYIIDTWESYRLYAIWQVPFIKKYYPLDYIFFF